MIAPFAFADLYVLRCDIGIQHLSARPRVADDHLYNLVSGEISVSAALFRSRRSARRPTLGLGSLSVLDAVRCCTARGSKLKVDAIVG